MIARSSIYGFANEKEYGEYLAQAYDFAMLTSAMSMMGDKFISGNPTVLKTMWGSAFKIGKSGGSPATIQNMKDIFNQGLQAYWTGAIFTPKPPVMLANVVTMSGNPNVLMFYNTNDTNAFVGNLLQNIKIYMLTIVGTGFVGVV